VVIQGSIRRLFFGFVIAVVLAFALLVVKVSTADAQVLIPSGCKGLTEWDALWWMRACYLY
jgi:hypothetical protein